ncbi:PSD1 and planctomycete cytochrome C domain-containing protein [Luteolibacter marinus]|uniref:PSD1 and planctomycete cytochrome C domain-containing protein n=1 Tax=Luteolibacter marinus TaxID=2776705 RepID=UPI001865AE84|nr:PSD1 and planctomycete cytochrome C domain-containing protein [Luteolibacter marinus]
MRCQLTILATLVLPLSAEVSVDFNRDVRPILTKNCTTCHGGVKMAGGVSYLYREDTLGKGDSGKAIVVPGHPEQSEMIARLLTEDLDERMPPPDHHPHPLPQQDIDTLTRWIKEGAKWGDHWSFQKPVMPALPAVKDQAWGKQELDRFILARLESEDLEPSPAAAPEEWLRRASLDITGLPPTPDEWAAFKQAWEGDPQAALEGATDRLLASPAFGEKWAAMWLDLARYSDTFGFEKDPHRDIWPFRDWVIRAFNADMPFDQFTLKQLAGDLIGEPEPGDLIATAFHRNTQNNSEGGTDDEEYRMNAVIDRVNTTWTAWNATTFGCVQCHAHPYDPIPHDDYYRFMAFFNNSEDVDINSDFPRTKVADDPALQADAVRLEQLVRQRRADMNTPMRELALKVADWQTLRFDKATAEPPTGILTQGEDGIVVTSGTTPNNTAFLFEAAARPLALIRVEIFPESDNPAEWRGRGAVVSGLEAAYVGADGTRTPIRLREVAADFIAGPFDPNDALAGNAGGVGDYPMTKSPRTAWFIPAQAVAPAGGDRLEIKVQHRATCNESQNCVVQRLRIATSEDPALIAYLDTPEHHALWNEVAELRKQYQAIPGMTIPVMQERSDAARRETRVFIRGNRMTLDKVVEPGIPELLGAPEKPRNRLDMARWIVGKENPLAARVLANRLWAELFGIGIVETLEDFGSSGALPSHPELLDFLALRLRDHHAWHLKPFLRELVLSATYRQSDKATPEIIGRDPRNRLLARGPRNRLTAEMVRDQALMVSGLLSRKMFGKPVFPPQPDGIWNSVYSGAKWDTSQGEDRYRRALYTYNKRTSGYPAFLTFDGSARDVCLARRIPTNTPLQALVTLNDPAHMEFAQAFAKRMAEAGPELGERLARGYQLLTLKQATPATLDTLRALHADAKAEYESTPAESAKLAPTPDEAALVLVANTLLNSDLALNR